MFPSNAYSDHYLLPESSITDLASSFDCFLGGNEPENELYLLTQSFDHSSLDHSPIRAPTGMIFDSIKSMADGFGQLLSFPNHVSAAVGHGTDSDHPSCSREMNSENIFVAGGNPQITKRSGKKDRHSKIVTAQGTRDRRMRLSLDIARRFFDLQDKLGYDKASKTVEWLMGQSEVAIGEVMQGKNHSAYISDCEDISGVEESTPIDYNEEDADQLNIEQNYSGPPPITTSSKSRKNKAQMRKPTFILLHDKESRAMARARARERTKEKQSRKLAIDHEKFNTATTIAASRYQYPQIEQQRPHYDHQQQIVSLIGAINNPDLVYNSFAHQDWAAHGGIR